MYILGINPGSHESSACLLENGMIIAVAEEERFTRLKHAINQMPCYAIQYCLEEGGIELSDVDYVATCWNVPHQSENSVQIETPEDNERFERRWRKVFPISHFGNSKLPTIFHVSHHLSHAAAVYRTSPFEEGALLIVDGQGDTVSTTLAHCANNNINILTQFDISQSLGFFYQAVTYYLGFGWLGSEGKTMGLAPYGTVMYDFPEITLTGDGYHIDAPKPWRRDTVDEMLSFWYRRLEEQFGNPKQLKQTYDLATGRQRKSLELGTFEKNLAASAQAKLEQVLVHLAQIALRVSNSTNLMFSGGVALNCSVNEKLLRETSAKELFLFPACGDAGAAVGAALELAHYLGVSSKTSFEAPFLGPAFNDASVVKVLNEYSIPYSECHNPAQKAAEFLFDNQIVAWFQGRMEIGPRALGHRSILANPQTSQTRDRVNQYAKRRELWRPLAPVLRKEDTSSCLGEDIASPYMLRAISVPQETQVRIPATIHIDGTARLQTVVEKTDPLFYELISTFATNSNIPAVLNTSFNDDAEPIVCSPHDAIRTFISTGIDVLIINNYVIKIKRSQKKRI